MAQASAIAWRGSNAVVLTGGVPSTRFFTKSRLLRMSFFRHQEIYHSDVYALTNPGSRPKPTPQLIVLMSLRSGIPRRLALQQRSPTLPRPKPFCRTRLRSSNRFQRTVTVESSCVSRNARSGKKIVSKVSNRSSSTNSLVHRDHRHRGVTPRRRPRVIHPYSEHRRHC